MARRAGDDDRSSVHPIGLLFQRSVLDPVVDIARAVSLDYVDRPRHYRTVPEDVARILEGFRIRTGTDPEWPSIEQRARLFAGIFDDPFRNASSELRGAARALAERTADVNPE